MIYIDSNIFIYSIVNSAEKGNRCREFLKRVENDNLVACTSVLTFDEIFWQLKKIMGFDKTLVATENFLNFPNLKFLDVTEAIMLKSFEIIKLYKLNPRDAIHAACCIMAGVTEIVSEDSDFDTVKGIKRKTL